MQGALQTVNVKYSSTQALPNTLFNTESAPPVVPAVIKYHNYYK